MSASDAALNYPRDVLWEKKGWETNLADEALTLTMSRLI